MQQMTPKEMQKRIRQLEQALLPFAYEGDTWSDNVPDRYRPGVTEPGSKQAHARARFTIGNCRKAMRLLPGFPK